MKHITVNELRQAQLTAGEPIALSGCLYTARDAAHKRLAARLAAGEPLPFDPRGAAIYYTGPAAAPPGRVIGSCGPTTSGRMDPYTPALYDLGLAATIGKGQRDAAVCGAIRRNGALYLCAVGGAGALLASKVASCEVAAFPDLGCEAIYKLEVEDFPLIVAIDGAGGNLFSAAMRCSHV
ncbi:MAG: FumA C-terminus/TtdB family hydratase beta subunit [Oscillospiraceae bacterium]|nr:FumA C-terminus/TtdB family hydratase beta subunit [Oscillospiraceae bacterium]